MAAGTGKFDMKAVVGVLLLVAVAAPSPALGWGASGHRMVGTVAMGVLPAELPAFLRTAEAAVAVGELSREPDRSRGAGKLHDSNRDPGHYLDVDDAGLVMGGPSVFAPPTTRADYEKALQAVGADSWQAGYLNYSIVDQVQQLTLDFAYWRVLRTAERNRAWRGRRKWFAQDRRRREGLILGTIGNLSHFVADGAQPQHVSIHSNGWGDHPNPQGYTTAKIHAAFEGAFVAGAVNPAQVAAGLAPARDCACPVEQRVADYLTASWRQVEPLYALEKAGGFRDRDPRGQAFAAGRLALAASELRDLIVLAWGASAGAAVGWKPVRAADVEAGRVDPYPSLMGVD